MLPLFERVLRHPNLKNTHLRVIVKIQTYILKPGERYESEDHSEGLGENIKAVGIYYPEISNIEGGDLLLKVEGESLSKLCTLHHRTPYTKCTVLYSPPKCVYGPHRRETVPVREGSSVVFINQIIHRASPMEYKSDITEILNTFNGNNEGHFDKGGKQASPNGNPKNKIDKAERTIIAFFLCECITDYRRYGCKLGF